MERNQYKKVEFVGFIVDIVQTNFNAMCEIFESKDKVILMIGKVDTQNSRESPSFKPCSNNFAMNIKITNQSCRYNNGGN